MKYLFLIIISMFSVRSCSSKGGATTIQPGQVWPDDRGVHINAHGGGILYHEDTYYWYGEHKSDTTSSAMVGINCYSSKDLLKWKYEGVVLPVVTNNDSADITIGSIMERPKVIYNKKTKKFVMWFHLELKGRGYKAARTALAISDTPTGTFTYIRSYRPNAGIYPLNFTDQQKSVQTTELDFVKKSPEMNKAVEEGLYVRRDLKGGQMSRDMTLFVDDDQKAYHIYASEENQTLHIAELTDDYLGHNGRYVRILPGGHNEAPTVLKRNGKYFLITSGCTGWNPNAARMAVADHILGPWKPLPNPCIGPNAELTFDAQGTYIQKIEGSKDSYIFMADRWNPDRPIDAKYVWLPITFVNDIPQIHWRDSWNIRQFSK